MSAETTLQFLQSTWRPGIDHIFFRFLYEIFAPDFAILTALLVQYPHLTNEGRNCVYVQGICRM